MTLHSGKNYEDEIILLSPPQPERIKATPQAEDVQEEVSWWLAQAAISDTVYYFSVFEREELIGQVLLHDIDRTTKEALIAYHLFQPGFRGHGIGTRMLTWLQQFVLTETDLSRLIIITSSDNLASQRIAQKCGFHYVGTPREDPVNGLVYQWKPRAVNEDAATFHAVWEFS